ncbi:DUF58 domain-containing protein [Arthrobacter sp. zg-Y750]|uniref:DUF58 domain-containing protein n=1 Tax=Arthrobacter sp. zg-Y750 TaxID=2894189 RepID=UPI001E4E508B|nr:DUF58 domain-containing protein [Arthrobacter sp. zg-Y750]MCC9179044.1 DUF58 domain-containing protein [Arthrobacter sp. zg-Y750]
MAPSSLTGFFTPRGWGLLAAGAVALLGAAALGREDLLALAVLLICLPLLAAATLRLVKPGFQVDRSFAPPLVETGTAATVTLSIRGRPASVSLIREGLPLRFGASPVFRFPPEGGAETGTGSYRYRLRSGRRGLYSIGPVTAEFLDPFGLAKTVHTLGGTNQLAVAPAPRDLPPAPIVGPAGTDGSSPSRRRGTPSEDDVTTREYRYGDPMRRVHWAATARHGELMVRQEEPVTAPTASILLDQRRPAYGSPGAFGADDGGLLTSEAFEWAVSAVISSAVFFAESGYAVRFTDELFRPGLSRSPSAVDADERLFHGADGLQDLAEGLAALGLADPAQVTGGPAPAAPFGDLLLDGLSAGRSPGPLLVVAGRISAAEAAALAPAARYSAQPMVLMVSDRPAEQRQAQRILHEAGWSTVAVGPGTPVPAAWSLLHAGNTPEPSPAAARSAARPVRSAPSTGAGRGSK